MSSAAQSREFCPTCGSALAYDKSGHILYGGRLSYRDFEQILLSLGASGSDVRRLWPGEVKVMTAADHASHGSQGGLPPLRRRVGGGAVGSRSAMGKERAETLRRVRSLPTYDRETDTVVVCRYVL